MRTGTPLLTGAGLAAALLGLHATVAGCDGGDMPRITCPMCQVPTSVGALANPELTELSGLAASAVFADVFYGHNDSGDSSRFFAFGKDGADLGSFRVDDAKNVDWEDMARGPCAAGSCLFLADIGDNHGDRKKLSIYRVPEPSALFPGEQVVYGDRFNFKYPDGHHDAEVLLVHPVSGAVTIVTKIGSRPASIFTLPQPMLIGSTMEATLAGEIAPPRGDAKLTGGAVHPDGTGVLLRSNTDLFFYAMSPGQTVAEALTGPPCPLPVAQEQSGEAVTWLADGAGLLTVGEGQGAALNRSSCTP